MTLTLLASLLIATAGLAQEGSYKPYVPAQTRTELLEIRFDKKSVWISTNVGDRQEQATFPRKELRVDTDGRITSGGTLVFADGEIVIGAVRRSLDDVSDLRLLENDGEITITLFSDESTLSQGRRPDNLVSAVKPIVVDENQFVRGIVFSLAGDIEVYGEVNKDVVSLLGDVYVGPAAVTRGDVASMNGRIDIARDAAVYGEIYTAEKRRIKERRRYHRAEFDFDDQARVSYDRVDGLYLQEGLRWDDSDSTLPSLWGHGGYAFASERWRYEFGIEQTILRRLPISIGASMYRRLVSEDYWLVGRNENTAMALVAGEDYRDYYEVEGAAVALTFRPVRPLTLQFGYYNEDNRWFDANQNLWSLFGGDFSFDPNFSSVDTSLRPQLISDLNNTTDVGLHASIELDTRHHGDSFRRSAWHFSGEGQWSRPSYDSDFDYKRYLLSLRRYQKVHRRAMLIGRVMYGKTEGAAPIHKQFFLGGLGSLRGYDFKEYRGTEFWMGNIEYRLRFPNHDLAVAPFLDFGKITNGGDLSDAEVKNSVGLGIYLGNDVRISMAKRLDRSYDDDIEFNVRLEHVF
jgi:hypothetical protein